MVSRPGPVRLGPIVCGLLLTVVLAACSHSTYHASVEDDPEYWRGSLKDSPPATARRQSRQAEVHRRHPQSVERRRRQPQAVKSNTNASSASRRSQQRPKKLQPRAPAQNTTPTSPYAPMPEKRVDSAPAVAPVNPAASTVPATGNITSAQVPARLPPPQMPQASGQPTSAANSAPCDPDGQPCALVTALAKDGDRGWLKRPPTRNETISGVRLQALRQTRVSLSCRELSAATEEVRAAVPTLEDALASARVAGQPVSRLSRTLLLANELSTSLGEERLKRCPA